MIKRLKKRKPIKLISDKQKIIKECDNLLRAELIKERGPFCQLSGHPANGLGLFHILPKGLYPRIRFHKFNLLLVNWHPYHYQWHHNAYRREEIEEKIKKILGNDYLQKLKIINATAPKMTILRIKMILEALKVNQKL